MSQSDLTHIHERIGSRVDPALEADWVDNDGEWEYEYDEQDTEDFFLTLDLTTHLPDALTKPRAAGNGRVTKGILDLRLKEYKRQTKEPSDDTPDRDQNSTPQPNDDLQSPAIVADENVADDAQTQDDRQPEQRNDSADQQTTAGSMQLIGLHTSHPYLMFDNKFFTTYWLTDLGTQIWVARPGISDSSVWSGNALDIVGLSQARLLAKPAKIEPKYDTTALGEGSLTKQTMRLTPAGVTISRDEQLRNGEPAQQLVIATTGMTDPALRAQASFMERLSALKIKKGERDQMPMYSVKAYELPADAAEIRAQAWDAKDAARAEGIPNAITEPSTRFARDPGQPLLGHVKSAKRKASTQRSRTTSSAIGDEATSNEHDDEDNNDMDNQGPNEDIDTADMPVEEPGSSVKRQPRKRNVKMTGLGIISQGSERMPKQKRKRRTKAEMEQARAAEAAARAAKALSLS